LNQVVGQLAEIDDLLAKHSRLLTGAFSADRYDLNGKRNRIGKVRVIVGAMNVAPAASMIVAVCFGSKADKLYVTATRLLRPS